MRTASVFLSLLLFLTTACNKAQDDEIAPAFDVVVQSIAGDCNMPLLDFGSRKDEVGKLIGLTSVNEFYYAVNLDSTYSKAGTSLQVKIRKITADEERACTTMGPSYPSIAITQVLR